MKHKTLTGLLTAAVLAFTAVPVMNAAADDLLETGNKDGYSWEHWNQDKEGIAEMTPGDKGTFSLLWQQTRNCFARSGHRWDDCLNWKEQENIVIDYALSDYQTNGVSCLSIYGWTKNVLTEYYIAEDYRGWLPPSGGQTGLVGEITVDGAVYDVYKLSRTGPTPENRVMPYTQLWSVRKGNSLRTEGSVDVTAHFREWEKLGLSVGDLYETYLSVEGYGSEDYLNCTCKVTKNDLTVTPKTDPVPAETTAPLTTTTPPAATDAVSASGHSIAIGNVTCAPGETVKVPVRVYNDAGTAGCQVFFELDNRLTLNKLERGPAYRKTPQTNIDLDYPSYVFAGSDTLQAENGSVLCYLNVTVPADATEGDSFTIGFYRGGMDGSILKIVDYDSDMLDVTFTDGIISVGKAPETTAVPETGTDKPVPGDSETAVGDVNGDGSCDLKDVVIMRRFLAGGWDLSINETAADINKDGSFDLKDVVILRRYLAGGWDITL